MQNKDVPNDLELEQLIVSSFVHSGNCRQHCIISLDTDDFHSAQYKTLFFIMKDLVRRNVEVTEGNLLREVLEQKDDHLKQAFASVAITDPMHTHDYIAEKIKDLKALSRKRWFFRFYEAASLQFSGRKKISDSVCSDWVRKLQEYNCAIQESTFKTAKEVLENTYEDPARSFLEEARIRMEKRIRGEPIECGIPLGYKDLDKIFPGFKPGHLTIIGARPGVGKTTFMCNILLNILRASDEGIGVFSLEMPIQELAEKIVCTEAGVSVSDLKTGWINEAGMKKLTQEAEKIMKHVLLLDDTGRLDLDLMETRAEFWAKTKGMKVLFIDYLQLITAGKFKSKYEEITHISQRLKMMAKRLKIAVVALAQLNRESEKSNKPKISDLRDSGSIEQDSDEIFLLSNPSETDIYNKSGQLEVNLAKNRFGPTGKASLNFEKTLGKLSNLGSLNENSEFSSFT